MSLLKEGWLDGWQVNGQTQPGNCKMSCGIYPEAFSMEKHVWNTFYKTSGYIKLLDICIHTLTHTQNGLVTST